MHSCVRIYVCVLGTYGFMSKVPLFEPNKQKQRHSTRSHFNATERLSRLAMKCRTLDKHLLEYNFLQIWFIEVAWIEVVAPRDLAG